MQPMVVCCLDISWKYSAAYIHASIIFCHEQTSAQTRARSRTFISYDLNAKAECERKPERVSARMPLWPDDDFQPKPEMSERQKKIILAFRLSFESDCSHLLRLKYVYGCVCVMCVWFWCLPFSRQKQKEREKWWHCQKKKHIVYKFLSVYRYGSDRFFFHINYIFFFFLSSSRARASIIFDIFFFFALAVKKWNKMEKILHQVERQSCAQISHANEMM